MILQELLSAVTEPDLPVVWVDAALPDDVWHRLATALDARGYRLLDLDEDGRVDSHNELLARFCSAVGRPVESCQNLNALKDMLLGLDDPPTAGWVILFKQTGFLRQIDEETFEDLLEVVGSVHDIKLERKGLVFKLVVSA